MLEIPPKWNAVPDLIMEDEEGIRSWKQIPSGREMKYHKDGGKGGRKKMSA